MSATKERYIKSIEADVKKLTPEAQEKIKAFAVYLLNATEEEKRKLFSIPGINEGFTAAVLEQIENLINSKQEGN